MRFLSAARSFPSLLRRAPSESRRYLGWCLRSVARSFTYYSSCCFCVFLPVLLLLLALCVPSLLVLLLLLPLALALLLLLLLLRANNGVSSLCCVLPRALPRPVLLPVLLMMCNAFTRASLPIASYMGCSHSTVRSAVVCQRRATLQCAQQTKFPVCPYPLRTKKHIPGIHAHAAATCSTATSSS